MITRRGGGHLWSWIIKHGETINTAMFPANCIRGFLLFITASCSFTCVCLQTAVLHAASRLTWTCVWWLPSLAGVQCDTVISRHARTHTHTHTHGLPQYSKAVNTSIYRQPRESCKTGLVSCQNVYRYPSRFPPSEIPSAFQPKGDRWLSKSYIDKTGFERSAEQILTMMTQFSRTTVVQIKRRARSSPRQKPKSPTSSRWSGTWGMLTADSQLSYRPETQ